MKPTASPIVYYGLFRRHQIRSVHLDKISKFEVTRVYLADPTQVDLLDLRMSSQAIINSGRVFAILCRDRSHDLHGDLEQLAIPTLIIHGDTDPIPAHVAKRLHESISGSSYVLLGHCGHFPYIEAPDKFFDCVEEFLAISQREATSSLHKRGNALE